MQKLRLFFKKYWITILIYVGLFALYAYLTASGRADPYLFPKVKAIGRAFWKNRSMMLLNMVSSFRLVIPSIVISVAISLTLGTVLGLHAKVRDVLYPVIYAFSVIPSILLSPFALLLAPSFTSASIFLIVYGSFWSTLFATITSIMTIDRRYLDKAAALELSPAARIFRVILPAASPGILGGFVNSLRSTFVMLVYAEMYGSHYGMGFFVKKFSEMGLYDNTWAGFLFMVVVLVIVMQFFEHLKKYLLKWTIN